MTAYEQRCRETCQWCRAGNNSRIGLKNPTVSFHNTVDGEIRCTALTIEQFSEEMAQERQALQVKYDELKTEYYSIRAALRACLSDEQNVANPRSIDKIRFITAERDQWHEKFEQRDREVNGAWFGIDYGWDIEPRSYFEENAPKSGDWMPLQMAVHYMWKRNPKVSELTEQLAAKDAEIKSFADQNQQVQEELDITRTLKAEAHGKFTAEIARLRLDSRNLLVILDAQIEISECDIEDEDRAIVEQIRAGTEGVTLYE